MSGNILEYFTGFVGSTEPAYLHFSSKMWILSVVASMAAANVFRIKLQSMSLESQTGANLKLKFAITFRSHMTNG